MRHLVRLYPKRWRDRYGALDAHLHPALGTQLVFVPAIGFRPGSTRTLLERAETSEDDTHLVILAVAASKEKTELLVEWERTSEVPEVATCLPPGATVDAPPDLTLTAMLATNGIELEATTIDGPWRLPIPLA